MKICLTAQSSFWNTARTLMVATVEVQARYFSRFQLAYYFGIVYYTIVFYVETGNGFGCRRIDVQNVDVDDIHFDHVWQELNK
jgi:hypothetical protein